VERILQQPHVGRSADRGPLTAPPKSNGWLSIVEFVLARIPAQTRPSGRQAADGVQPQARDHPFGKPSSMKSYVVRRNNVNVFGSGTQPMLFAHGFGCDQNMWRYVTEAFEREYRIVLFDYVGSGRSELTAYDPERYRRLEGYSADVLDICHALDLSDVIFVGHSVSSVIGVLAANQEPDRFANLILIGPSPRYINDPPCYVGGFDRADIDGLLEMMDKNFIGWANFLAPVIMKNPDRPELSEDLRESFCSTDPVIARRFAEATFLSDNREDLARLTVPSLILQCAQDSIAPTEVGEYVHRQTPGSTFQMLDATGHCPHMSHPEETIRAMRDYLARAAQGAQSAPR
jgi:sigma-B regulation protein RsbQ